MERVPEPELMDQQAQAEAYAQADFSVPHQAFVDHFRRLFPAHAPRRILDLGCGAADISVRFARAWPQGQLTAIDGAPAMLRCARTAVRDAGLEARIVLHNLRLPDLAGISRDFDTVISNSLLHHLHDPTVMWRAIQSLALPGAAVLVMDLFRPPSCEAVDALVSAHAAAEPEILRRDFANSLCAAFRPNEVRAQLRQAGLAFKVETVSDRHLLVHGMMPRA
jgi:ubiquinone/menaquinone biosynthesis C-methylase UbiE